MIDTVPEQRRSCVRGDLIFRVKYRIITRKEYEKSKKTIDPILYRDYNRFKIDIGNTDNIRNEISPNVSLIDFLFQIDEKLDRILSLLSEKEDWPEIYSEGIGSNISGSGMSLRIDKPAERNQIIHTNFLLSKLPYVCINLFGEIVHITPLNEEGKMFYNLGIKFVDPDETAREKIIARVFETQRKAIRSTKYQE